MSDQQVQWRELIDAALTVPGSLGATYCRFYNYSFTDQILLFMQGVSEPVATYKRWSEMGRQVRKGSKARAIIRPIRVRKHAENTDEPDQYFIKGFKLVNCLFPLSDTDGETTPPPAAIPEWNRDVALTELAITQVPFAITDGNVQGYSTGRSFALNPLADYPVKTMFHELAHIVLGHTEGGGYQHKGIAEFQAEAVALIVMKELDLLGQINEAQSRAYVQTWLDGTEPTDEHIKDVFGAVNKILTAGRAHELFVAEVA